jgi:Holliday junction DNA helicase RuvB
VRITLNHFTLVGATTRSGLLTAPLRERFGITCALEYYDTEELVKIVKRSAYILKIGIEEQAAREIAMRSRGTPRIANALLKRVRDFAQVMGDGLSIAFNPKYVLNVLKNVEDERVYLECNSPINPCVIRPVDDESSFYLIVPMRIF